MSETSLAHASPFQVAGYRVDPASLRVIADGDEARLEAKTMRVLVYLAAHAGRVVSRTELEEQVWPGRIVTEDSVTKAIAKLRRVLRDDARHPRVIETLPKTGYRLIVDVTPIDDGNDQARVSWTPTLAVRRRGGRSGLPRILGGLSVLSLLLFATWGFLEWDWVSPFRPDDRLADPVTRKPSIAVVPFENLGVTPEEDYFANGIAADLITDLSKVEGLLVIAPGTTFTYEQGSTGLRQISAELDLDYVVVGSVQRQSSTLRINVQLVEASVGRAVWGERYTGLRHELFDIQDRLAAALIAALQVEIGPAERAYLASRPTASVDAYDYYLRGLEDHGSRTETQNLSARAHFEKAIELDSTFARAYAGLALTYSREAIDGWTSAPTRSLELAAALASKAARMDSSLPQVHFVAGQVALFQRLHGRAIESAERAIEVDPNYADAYALLAWTLNYAGRSGKALSALKRAMRLNPRPPASYLEILGEIRFAQARYGESASTFRAVLDTNPGYTRARMWNAAALARAGSVEEAAWEVAELLVASPDLSLTRLALAFPFKDPRTLNNLMEALRMAGLPAR